ncbi:MAG: AzlD domain-containing protein [Polaromonas sp.]|nr:AzlD domain-containing protein [Polaromonas sp.]
MNQTDSWTVVTILGMVVITVLTRGFFFISTRPWKLPGWAQRGLNYAPIAALAAVIAPEIVMTQGHLISTWLDARIFSAIAAILWFYWRGGVLGTILVGMAVYLPLHVGLLW